jgi:hypothetical protein
MANLIDISKNESKETIVKRLSRIIQSANLNFLIGSGCSTPAIKVMGNIEDKINQAREKEDNDSAECILYEFLLPLLNNTKLLINNEVETMKNELDNYRSFIENISNILFTRKSNIIESQAIIFSTNYDLLLEHAMNDYNESFILCDGFKRTSNINKEYYFSSTEYFNAVYNTGNLYRYKVEIPVINLIKLHGSLNWQNKNEKIIQDLSFIEKINTIKDSRNVDDKKKFNSFFNIVLPQKDKFKITILEQIYYDLLRIYSNELDKENTVLFVEGFSFSDEHILEITRRALRNKTFNLVVFCFNEAASETLYSFFEAHKNVDIISNGKNELSFKQFNDLLSEIVLTKNDED